ncbi:S1 family peptidase [Photobacterium leiognathi]|uniref:Serine protease n=1 Tax=Photobacterium leiognathi TaxID=553611 RepID=A0ABX5GLD8_PHOLE|nr:serine protease [Photobacterium leiognathi]KJF91968.1 trypsin family protein [Photobacterium leiognathi]PSV86626.1 serine protease [Photobacterium leiognathi]
MKYHLWVGYIFLSFFLFINPYTYSSTNSQPITKAINGTDATLYAPLLLPWQAAIKQNSYDSISCGAVVISEFWLLTAAHCNPIDIDEIAIAGTSLIKDGDFSDLDQKYQFKIKQIIPHPDYNEDYFLNDITLLRVERSLYEVAQPIKIATIEEQYLADIEFESSWITYGNSPATVIASGWGDTLEFNSPTTLQVITLAGVPDNQCNGLILNDDQMVCADSNINGLIKDVCRGDSGGPLIWQNKSNIMDSDKGIRLIGLTSNGQRCSIRINESENQYNQLTGQYTQVSTHREWIEQQIRLHGKKPSFSLDDNSLRPTLDTDPFSVAKDIPDNNEEIIKNTYRSGGNISLNWLFSGLIIMIWRRNLTKRYKYNS